MRIKRFGSRRDGLIGLLMVLGMASSLLLWLGSAGSPTDERPVAPVHLFPVFDIIGEYRQAMIGPDNDARSEMDLMTLEHELPPALRSLQIELMARMDGYRDARRQRLEAESEAAFLIQRIREEGWRIRQLSRQLEGASSLGRLVARLDAHLGRYLKTEDRARLRSIAQEQIAPLIVEMRQGLEGAEGEAATMLRDELDKLERQVVATQALAESLWRRHQARNDEERQRREVWMALTALERGALELPMPRERSKPSAWPRWAAVGIGVLVLVVGWSALRVTRQPAVVDASPASDAGVFAESGLPAAFANPARDAIRALHAIRCELTERIERLETALQRVLSATGARSRLASSPSAKDGNGELEAIEQGLQSQSEEVEAIDRYCERIEEAIAEVEEIAFGINLLALNAAVEAAHAGESGKGFAIVAAEVRDLAQRSSASAESIRSLVGGATGAVEALRERLDMATAAARGLKSRWEEAQTQGCVVPFDAGRVTNEVADAIASDLTAVASLNARLDEESRRLRDLLRAHFRADPTPAARSAVDRNLSSG